MQKGTDTVIVSCCRTPLGTFQGGLSRISATELGALTIKEALKRAHLHPEEVDEVLMGMVLPCGYGQNPARQASIMADIPMEKSALTINKVCGSGLMAVVPCRSVHHNGICRFCCSGRAWKT